MQSPFDLIELILFKAQEKKNYWTSNWHLQSCPKACANPNICQLANGIPFVMIITGVAHAFERFLSTFLFLHPINFIKP